MDKTETTLENRSRSIDQFPQEIRGAQSRDNKRKTSCLGPFCVMQCNYIPEQNKIATDAVNGSAINKNQSANFGRRAVNGSAINENPQQPLCNIKYLLGHLTKQSSELQDPLLALETERKTYNGHRQGRKGFGNGQLNKYAGRERSSLPTSQGILLPWPSAGKRTNIHPGARSQGELQTST